jgi:hypothetical protein
MKKFYYHDFDSERSIIKILRYISYLRISETERYRRHNISKSMHIISDQKRNLRTDVFL